MRGGYHLFNKIGCWLSPALDLLCPTLIVELKSGWHKVGVGSGCQLAAGSKYIPGIPASSVGFVYSACEYASLTELTGVTGTGMGVVQNSQKFRVGTRMSYPYPYPHAGIFTRAYPYPGYCATSLQNLQKFRVRV